MARKNDDSEQVSVLAQSIAKHLTETLGACSGRLDARGAEGALARGQVFQIADYYNEAAESYGEALALDPTLDEAAARLVIVQLVAGEKAKALANAMKLAARSPDFEFRESSSDQYISVMTVLGDALAFNGRTDDALKAYGLALSSSKRDSFAAGRLTQLHLASGQPQKALDHVADIRGNSRFRDLERMLSLGQKDAALLPSFAPASIIGILANAMPGRPLMIGGEARTASVVWGDDRWCLEPAEHVARHDTATR